ncbi:hypothetical protein [Luteimonas sp. MJ250]
MNATVNAHSLTKLARESPAMIWQKMHPFAIALSERPNTRIKPRREAVSA